MKSSQKTVLDSNLDYLSNLLFTQKLYLELRKDGTLPTSSEIQKMNTNIDFDILDLDQPNYRKKLNKEVKRMRDSIKRIKNQITLDIESGRSENTLQEENDKWLDYMRNK